MKAKIYHNPRCSKSRQTLALLESRGLDIDIVEYITNPLEPSEIANLLVLLNCDAADLVRTGEAAFEASGLNRNSPASDLIALMHEAPVVMQRPIVVIGDGARIGRPPDKVLELID